MISVAKKDEKPVKGEKPSTVTVSGPVVTVTGAQDGHKVIDGKWEKILD